MSKLPVFCAITVITVTVLACGGGDAPPADTVATTTIDVAEPVVVASGLNGPIGILVDADGTVYVSDSGTGGDNQMVVPYPGMDEPVTIYWGETARVVRVDPSGTQTTVAMLPSLLIPEGPQGTARFARHDGTLYVASGAWGEVADIERPQNMAAVVRLADDGAAEYTNTWDFENRENPEPAHRETNPFDLTVGPDNAMWLTDAAGNALYRINPADGALELKAVFNAIPGPLPNAARDNAMEIEAVPTAVAFDSNGNMFVSLLRGVPFLPGTSAVVQVGEDGQVTDYATDLTMLTDLVTGPDGQLYGLSIGEFNEQGPVPNSGAVLRIGPGTTSETILSGLSLPASIAFTANGDAYITVNALGEPGSGQVVRYAGLVHGG